MEFHKEEARRALAIADKKLSENDFDGAKRFVDKAMRLYPELDGLKQVLTMIHVYVSAANKISGGGGEEDADWYGILNVDPLADDEAVKKQYKKLALLLHPDKNRFDSAEGAFKLVLEAWCVLSDSSKRLAYDHKRKTKETETGMQKTANPQKAASSKRNQKVKVGVNPPSGKGWSKFWFVSTIFAWTMCSRCRTQCEYVREPCLNKAIHCPNCGHTFIAKEKVPWTSFVKPVNLSSSPQQKQQQSDRKKATTEKTKGVSSSSASATPKPPQASAQNQDTKRNTSGTSSEESSSPSVSANRKTPEASVWEPVVNLSSSPQQQEQQGSAQNESTGQNTRRFSFSFKATSTSKNVASSKRVRKESRKTFAAEEEDRILQKPKTQM